MLRKRGMAFVVLFLFVILQSNHIFAEDVMAGTVGRLSLTVLNSFDGEAGDFFPKDDDYSKEYTDREQPRSGMGEIGNCPNTVGCVVGVHIPDPGGDEIEKHMAHINTYGDVVDDDNDDIRFCTQVKPGTHLQYPTLSSSGLGSQVVGGHPIEGQADDWNLAAVKYRSPNQNQEFICGDNHFWVVCSTPNKNKIARADSTVYRCIVDNSGIGEWTKIGDDKDNDGYIRTIDDKDDRIPAASCPTLSTEELLVLKTVEEIRAAMLTKCNADRVRYSTCSSCINPAAPEVCGDGEDNDGKEETKDNCNENRAACIQESPSLNIYNEKFAYTNGFCCGFNRIDDLGKVSGNLACLKKT